MECKKEQQRCLTPCRSCYSVSICTETCLSHYSGLKITYKFSTDHGSVKQACLQLLPIVGRFGYHTFIPAPSFMPDSFAQQIRCDFLHMVSCECKQWFAWFQCCSYQNHVKAELNYCSMPTMIVKLSQQARLGVKQTYEMLDGSLRKMNGWIWGSEWQRGYLTISSCPVTVLQSSQLFPH